MANGDDREAFKALWTTWKAGKGKPETDADKVRLLATATVLLGGAVEGYCEASLRYLRSVRDEMFRRLQLAAGQEGADPIRLLRGLRGGGADDLSFRLYERLAMGRLLSYSATKAGGVTFAGMGHKPGLVYELPVRLSEIVFFEDPDLCNEYVDEQEVLVLHRAPPTSRPVAVERAVPKRAKMKFSKTAATPVPGNVAAVAATRQHLLHDRILRLLDCKPVAIDFILGDVGKGGAAACVLLDGEPVGVAIVASEDRSLSVVVHSDLYRGGLGELAARKAIGLAFERGLTDVTARARLGTSGAGLAERLGFKPTGSDAREVFLALRRDEWKP